MSETHDLFSIFPIDHYGNYEDEFANLKPHQSFVYKLGLELALSYTVNDQSDTLPSNVLAGLKQKTEDFHFKMKQCSLCDFKTESRLVMDNHLSEPHCSAYRFRCNYCNSYNEKGKEKYIDHLLKEHKRVPKLEKPFIDVNLMCPICDYETPTSNIKPKAIEFERAQNHAKLECPFRENNLSRVNPILKTDFNSILNQLQSPSQFDLLDYQYVFNAKPIDEFVNKYNIFTASLIKTNSSLASQAVQEEHFNFQNIKMLEGLLSQENGDLNTKANVHVETKTMDKTLSSRKNISNSINYPLLDAPKIEKSSHIQCEKCSKSFSQTDLQSYEKHLIAFHGITKISELKSLLEKYLHFRSSQVNNRDNQSIKVIKLNQNLVLVKKNTNISDLSRELKKSLEFDESIRNEPVKRSKTCDVNTSTNEFSDSIEVKLKEIESEKHLIYSSLQLNKSDSELIEVRALPGKCYVCNNNTQFSNLIKHLKHAHKETIINSVKSRYCLLCGVKHKSIDKLIKHQFNSHKSILFSSLNKIFTVESESDTSTSTVSHSSFNESNANLNENDDDVIIIEEEDFGSKSKINLKIETENSIEKKKDLKCLKCLNKYDCFSDLLAHVRSEHQNTLSDKKIERVESISCVENKVIECGFCDTSKFSSTTDYEEHLKQFHMKKCQIKVNKLNESTVLRRSNRSRNSTNF